MKPLLFLFVFIGSYVPSVETVPVVGKWSVVKYARGSYLYPDSLVNNMAVYFTDKHALLRIGDNIGENFYKLKSVNNHYQIDLIANDGSKKGEETWGIASYDSDSKIFKLYMSVKPGIRPNNIPESPADNHDLIVLKKLEK
jgi:hypothetical protein